MIIVALTRARRVHYAIGAAAESDWGEWATCAVPDRSRRRGAAVDVGADGADSFILATCSSRLGGAAAADCLRRFFLVEFRFGRTMERSAAMTRSGGAVATIHQLVDIPRL